MDLVAEDLKVPEKRDRVEGSELAGRLGGSWAEETGP
jgi:hypothetical protein